MKAPLSKKVKELFNRPKELKQLGMAIKALDENNLKVKTKIGNKNIILIEIR